MRWPVRTLAQRFWEKVRKTETCWLWTASKNPYGYGQMIREGRLSWEFAHGVIPEGLCVLHRCDVPACVRVDHLFLGTKADNTDDMVAKGRASGGNLRGELHGNSKLTAQMVLEIRSRPSINQGALAKEFGN